VVVGEEVLGDVCADGALFRVRGEGCEGFGGVGRGAEDVGVGCYVCGGGWVSLRFRRVSDSCCSRYEDVWFALLRGGWWAYYYAFVVAVPRV